MKNGVSSSCSSAWSLSSRLYGGTALSRGGEVQNNKGPASNLSDGYHKDPS